MPIKRTPAEHHKYQQTILASLTDTSKDEILLAAPKENPA